MQNFKSLPKKLTKFIKSLNLKKYRQINNSFVIEGEKSILSALNSNYQINTLIVSDKFYKKYNKIFNEDLNIYIVNEKELSTITNQKTNNNGIAILNIKSLKTLVLKKDEYYLALDNISDPGNLGTIIRIADWYGINNIICSEDTVDFYNPKVIQASMGSFLKISAYYLNLKDFLSNIEIPIFAAVLNGKNIHEFIFPNRGLLLIGNESKGINKELLNIVNNKITIPKYGNAESLNAGIATAIICDKWRFCNKK